MGCVFLAFSQDPLQVREAPLSAVRPVGLAIEIDQHVGEFKDHVKNSVFADPLRQLRSADTIGLPDGKDIFSSLNLILKFVEIIQDAIRVRRHVVDGGHPVAGIRLSVFEFRFFNISDRVHPEAAYSLVKPEICHVVESAANLGVLPVEVRLLTQESVQIVLSPRLGPGPGGTSKNTAPVCGRAPVGFGVAPDIPVTFGIILSGRGFDKPAVLVGGMVENEVHDNADVPFSCLGNQSVHVFHGPEGLINLVIVSNVVAVVCLWRFVAGSQPYGTDAHLLQIIQLFGDSVQVSDAVPVRIVEASDINLTDIGFLPPFQSLSHLDLAFHRRRFIGCFRLRLRPSFRCRLRLLPRLSF